MIQADWKQKERSFIAASVFLVVVLVVVLGYSLAFLSTSLVHAFSSPTNEDIPMLTFDVEGFNSLGLK